MTPSEGEIGSTLAELVNLATEDQPMSYNPSARLFRIRAAAIRLRDLMEEALGEPQTS